MIDAHSGPALLRQRQLAYDSVRWRLDPDPDVSFVIPSNTPLAKLLDMGMSHVRFNQHRYDPSSLVTQDESISLGFNRYVRETYTVNYPLAETKPYGFSVQEALVSPDGHHVQTVGFNASVDLHRFGMAIAGSVVHRLAKRQDDIFVLPTELFQFCLLCIARTWNDLVNQAAANRIRRFLQMCVDFKLWHERVGNDQLGALDQLKTSLLDTKVVVEIYNLIVNGQGTKKFHEFFFVPHCFSQKKQGMCSTCPRWPRNCSRTTWESSCLPTRCPIRSCPTWIRPTAAN